MTDEEFMAFLESLGLGARDAIEPARSHLDRNQLTRSRRDMVADAFAQGRPSAREDFGAMGRELGGIAGRAGRGLGRGFVDATEAWGQTINNLIGGGLAHLQAAPLYAEMAAGEFDDRATNALQRLNRLPGPMRAPYAQPEAFQQGYMQADAAAFTDDVLSRPPPTEEDPYLAALFEALEAERAIRPARPRVERPLMTWEQQYIDEFNRERHQRGFPDSQFPADDLLEWRKQR